MFAGKFVPLWALVLPLCGMCTSPQAPPQEHVHYSRAQLRQMTRDAQTPEQIQVLAKLYRAEEQLARARAQARSEELERLRRNPGGSTKYPSRVDSARALRDYYTYRADTMAKIAANFERRLPGKLGSGQGVAAAEEPAPIPDTADREVRMQAETAPFSGNEKLILNRIEQLEQEIRELRRMSGK